MPNTPQTRFEIGSLTKQFTATAILHLVEAGKVRLDAPISTDIPDLPNAWSSITIPQFHEGIAFGFGSFIARYPSDHLLVVVLSNQEGTDVKSIADTLGRLAFEIIK